METRPGTLSIIEDFAAEIKAEPEVYMGFELTDNDLSAMMGDAVALAQEKIPGLSVTSNLKVTIDNDKCLITGPVNVDHPAFGHSSVDVNSLRLGNSSTPGLLQVEDSKFTKNLSTRVSLAAMAAGVNVDSEIQGVLSDPNNAIRKVMAEELQKQGVQLMQMGLQFRDGKLGLGISGKPTSR